MILISIYFFPVTKKYEAWRLKASSCRYSLNISRGSCCLTRMRHVFVWWDTNIQEIPRRGGPIQTIRPRVPEPWVQPLWWSRDYVLFLYPKFFYFLNWMNYWRAMSISVYFLIINNYQAILNWIRSFLSWFEYDYLRICTGIWLWLNIKIGLIKQRSVNKLII